MFFSHINVSISLSIPLFKMNKTMSLGDMFLFLGVLGLKNN